jgi:hypothetical protein
MTSATSDTEESISRDPGTCVHGFIVGGGQRGKREDQDEAVKEFARRLNDEFPHEVSIRFNTNRLSGSAWLVDGERNAQVGLGAALRPPREHKRQRKQAIYGDGEDPPSIDRVDPDRLDLVHTVKVDVPAIPEYRATEMLDRPDRTSYVAKDFEDLDRAWKWFINSVQREHVNPPAVTSE